MARGEIRVNKGREDQEIEEAVAGFIASGSFQVKLPARSLFEAFVRFLKAQQEDFEEQLLNRDAPPEAFLSDDEKHIRIEQLAQCAFDYCATQMGEKFRAAFIELIRESLIFSDSIWLERCGAGEEQINDARPSLADFQHNVLRFSLQRARSLPVREPDRSENDEKLQPLLRATYEIINNLVSHSYDHVRVYEFLRQAAQQAIEKQDAKQGVTRDAEEVDALSHVAAREMAELIWEHIDSGVGLGIRLMLSLASAVAVPSFAQQHGIAESEVREQMTSVTDFKEEIGIPLLDDWLKTFSPLFSRVGRPPNNLGDERLDTERERFIQDVKAAIEELKTVNKGKIGLKLGYGKNREGLEPNKAAAAKALREKAKRLGVDVGALIRAKKDRT